MHTPPFSSCNLHSKHTPRFRVVSVFVDSTATTHRTDLAWCVLWSFWWSPASCSVNSALIPHSFWISNSPNPRWDLTCSTQTEYSGFVETLRCWQGWIDCAQYRASIYRSSMLRGWSPHSSIWNSYVMVNHLPQKLDVPAVSLPWLRHHSGR